ncbi:MAG: neutral/alkaline non-lysosomal ceramidase N-terminal domain-containing protein [Pirellulales bacterium]
MVAKFFGMFAVVVAALASLPLVSQAGQWKAGTAVVNVTPKEPMWMAGYASRTKPSEGVALDLYCKALALEDDAGRRAVIVTCDLIGIPRDLRENVAAACEREYKLPPERLLLNASHTHCGPEFRRQKKETLALSDERARQGAEYAELLEKQWIALVGEALENLAPAKVSYVQARCGFAMNRRTPSESGYKNAPWSEGPVDHVVPVLKIDGADGKLRAVLFGYACHNTTLGFQQFCGDYAGYAQQYLEERRPGTTAHFFMGCGGDQNPYPRRELEYARQHGKSLGIAVEAARESAPARELQGPLGAALTMATLDFAPPPPKEVLQRQTQSPNKFEARHAERLLEELAETGKIATTYGAPLQALQFGDDLTIVAFPGETVVDYAFALAAISATTNASSGRPVIRTTCLRMFPRSACCSKEATKPAVRCSTAGFPGRFRSTWKSASCRPRPTR